MSKTIVTLFLPLLLFAVQWHDWESGVAKAKQTHKPLLVSFVREGCHYCHDMERAVFDDTDMSAWITSCFVPVKINLTYDKAPFSARIPMTPTFVLLQPDAKTIIKSVPGSWNIPDFKALTESVCHKEQ